MNYTILRDRRGCQDLLKSASKPGISGHRVAAPIPEFWDSLPQKCKIVVASFLSRQSRRLTQRVRERPG